MRCEFYKKTDKNSKTKFRCKACIYGVFSSSRDSIFIKEIRPEHNHDLYTETEIDQLLKGKIASVPESIKEEAYNLFLRGFTSQEVMKINKERYYKDTECPFDHIALKNFLYEKLKSQQIRYNNIEDIYNAIISEKSQNKQILVREDKVGDNLKGIAFTFEDQVDKCRKIFLKND